MHRKNGLVDELGDIDIAIDKVVALVNQHPDKYMDNFSVQWLVDEDNSFLAKLDRKLKQKRPSVTDKLVRITTGSSSSEKTTECVNQI